MAIVVKYVLSVDGSDEKVLSGAVETAIATAYGWPLPILYDSVEAVMADAVFKITFERVDIPTPKYEGM